MQADNDSFFAAAPEGQLAVDVIETFRDIIIRTAIAGVKPEDVHVHVTNDVVTIRGERKPYTYTTDSTVHFAECFWGAFSRSIILPHHVNPDQAQAQFENGVLTLTIPKLVGEKTITLTL